jgi:subfamily B ATP-binding cassette protein MsbA
MRDFFRVLGVAKRHALWMLLALICMVIVTGSTVFAYNLVRPVYDRLLQPKDEVAGSATPAKGLVASLDSIAGEAEGWLRARVGESPANVLLLILGALLVKNAATFSARFFSARYGLATIRDLRDLIFDALLGQSPAYFIKTSSGVLVSRVVNDVQLIHEALAERLGDLIQDLLIVTALIVYLYSLDLRLAVATTVVAPVMLLPVVHFSRRLRSKSRQAQDRMGEMASVIGESVRGIDIVQAFGAEASERRRFRLASHRHFGAYLRARAIQVANGPVMEMVGALAAVALIGYASAQIVAGDMTLGDFSAFLVAAWGAYNPVKRLNKFNLALQHAVVASERVFDVIDAPVEVRNRPGATDLAGLGDGVFLDDVWFAYEGDYWVLKGIRIDMPTGTTVALVGPSGSGKSTVARLLSRFWDVQRGTIVAGGTDLRDLRLKSLRAQIGLVTQETVLFNESVRNNIAFGQDSASDVEVEAAARAARAHGFVRALPEGYDTMLGEGGYRLSGGQRQRIAIARAVLKDAPLLILDEATSALDPAEGRLVQRALDDLMRDRTTLLIAHRLSTVRRADQIVVLDGGRIVERGSHEELVEMGGVYRRLVAAEESAE